MKKPYFEDTDVIKEVFTEGKIPPFEKELRLLIEYVRMSNDYELFKFFREFICRKDIDKIYETLLDFKAHSEGKWKTIK